MLDRTSSVQETILDLVEKYGFIPVPVLIRDTEMEHPGQRVRTAYWMLMSEGKIATDAAGMVSIPKRFTEGT